MADEKNVDVDTDTVNTEGGVSDGFVNEEFGVPFRKDGIKQDPNNHNGPKPGDSSGPNPGALGGLNTEEIADGEGQDRVEKAKASDKAETPESPRQRGSASASKQPETR